ALEEAMESYSGTLIFASHDRRLISRIATCLWVINDGNLTQVDGGLEAHERLLPSDRRRPGWHGVIQEREGEGMRPKYDPALSALEEEMGSLESAQAGLTREIEREGTCSDVPAVTELGRRFEAIEAELDRLLNEWFERAAQA